MDNDAVLVTTMNDVPGFKIVAVYGEVFGLICRARNVFSNIGAGPAHDYLAAKSPATPNCSPTAVEQAIDRLRLAAIEKGGNAVIAMRFDCNEIGDIMSEIAAYGTAVRIEKL